MNKKGFTITELLAVLVIIGILSVIAITAILPLFNKANTDSFVEEAKIIADGATTRYADDRLRKDFSHDIYNGTVAGKVCYSIQDSLIGSFISKDDDNYKGSVEVCKNCVHQTKVWLTNGEYIVDGVSKENIKKSSIESRSFDDDFYLSCGQDPSLFEVTE